MTTTDTTTDTTTPAGPPVVIIDPVGMPDIAEMIGVTPQHVKRLRAERLMPPAEAVVARTPIWSRSTISQWAAVRRNRPGRPRAGEVIQRW